MATATPFFSSSSFPFLCASGFWLLEKPDAQGKKKRTTPIHQNHASRHRRTSPPTDFTLSVSVRILPHSCRFLSPVPRSPRTQPAPFFFLFSHDSQQKGYSSVPGCGRTSGPPDTQCKRVSNSWWNLKPELLCVCRKSASNFVVQAFSRMNTCVNIVVFDCTYIWLSQSSDPSILLRTRAFWQHVYG